MDMAMVRAAFVPTVFPSSVAPSLHEQDASCSRGLNSSSAPSFGKWESHLASSSLGFNSSSVPSFGKWESHRGSSSLGFNSSSVPSLGKWESHRASGSLGFNSSAVPNFGKWESHLASSSLGFYSSSVPSVGKWESHLAASSLGCSSSSVPSSSKLESMRVRGVYGRRGRNRGGVCTALRKLDEVEAVELSAESGGEFPAAAGVYAVYDKKGKMQFVGLSRRVAASLQAHVQDLPELCGSVKVAVVDAPDKVALTEAWRQWIQEHVDETGEAPPGNVSGVTTWTTRKVRATKPELKLTPGPQKELTIPLTELIDKVVKEIPVVAFIKGTRVAPQCGFSHRVLTILNENRVDYETVNVLDDHFNPGIRDAIKTYSKWPTIPQLYVKGEFVGGADILTDLVESGKIKSLFKV